MIAPRWSQPKIGPILRGERDWRLYFGQLRPLPEYIRGLTRWNLLWRGKYVPERNYTPADEKAAQEQRQPTIVSFQDCHDSYEELFRAIRGEQRFLLPRLNAILHPKMQRKLAKFPMDFGIALHVRRGDKPPLNPEEVPSRAHWSPSDQWYINVIRTIRAQIGEETPVNVFTDSRPEVIRAILDLPNVHLVESNKAIVDMILLSRAKALVTSGTSTFSMWAAYLGGMPTVWYPGSVLSQNAENPWFDSETDYKGNVAASFAKAYRMHLDSHPVPLL